MGWLGLDGESTFRVSERAPGILEVETNSDREGFEHYFCLDTTFADVRRRIIEASPALRDTLADGPAIRLCHPATPHETFFCFLCTANNHLPRIHAMIRTLCSYGEGRFPSIARLAEISEAELRTRGFGYRAKTIPRAAAYLADKGWRWLERLRDGTYQNAFGELREIEGIGPKLADCICLYGLHFGQAVPIDTHVWQSACRHFFPELRGKALTERRYLEIGGRFRDMFGDLAGWAQLLLYHENLRRGRIRSSASS